jgi:hypothetical protein
MLPLCPCKSPWVKIKSHNSFNFVPSSIHQSHWKHNYCMLLNAKRMWIVDKVAWGNLISHIHICALRCTIGLPLWTCCLSTYASYLGSKSNYKNFITLFLRPYSNRIKNTQQLLVSTMVIHTQIVWNVDIWAWGNMIAHMRGLGIYNASVKSSIEKHVSYYFQMSWLWK